MPPKNQGGTRLFLMNPGGDLKKHFYFFERKFHFSTDSSLLVGPDTPFFGRIRVVIWKNIFVFSNGNFTSRRPAHFLPHVTNIFWDVFGLVRASAFLFFQHVFTHFGWWRASKNNVTSGFSSILGKDPRLQFWKITFLGSGVMRTNERTDDRQKNENLGHPNISAFGAIKWTLDK